MTGAIENANKTSYTLSESSGTTSQQYDRTRELARVNSVCLCVSVQILLQATLRKWSSTCEMKIAFYFSYQVVIQSQCDIKYNCVDVQNVESSS